MVLLRGFGRAHSFWVSTPIRAAFVAFFFYLFVVGFSVALDIHFVVSDGKGGEFKGFLSSHWGPLFFVATPLAAILVGFLFQALDRALLSLDDVLSPTQKKFPKFSVWLGDRFRYAWGFWIFPVCILLPVALSFIADGPDIIAPLQSATIGASADKDWSTLGYKTHPKISPLFFLIFNIMAFGLQSFIAYCGFLLLIVISYHLVIFAKHGLGQKEWKSPQYWPGLHGESIAFNINWKYYDITGRCGLFLMDRVFALYLLQILISIGIAIWSVLANESSKTGVDLGSGILIFGNLILFPVTFFWIVIPYWFYFPRRLPAGLEEKGYTPPKPWPMGAQKLTWLSITVTWCAWIYLFTKGWPSVRVFLGIV